MLKRGTSQVIVNTCDIQKLDRPTVREDCHNIKVKGGKCCFVQFRNRTNSFTSNTCIKLSWETLREEGKIKKLEGQFSSKKTALRIDCDSVFHYIGNIWYIILMLIL
jgi:hypothetical protein